MLKKIILSLIIFTIVLFLYGCDDRAIEIVPGESSVIDSITPAERTVITTDSGKSYQLNRKVIYRTGDSAIVRYSIYSLDEAKSGIYDYRLSKINGEWTVQQKVLYYQ